MRNRLDLEEAKLSIEVANKAAVNLYERKGHYSVPYLRSIIQIAKENLEKEFNYPVSEYSDWYIVKCKMTDEEARQSEMDHRVFQITMNRKIVELFTKELKKRHKLTMDDVLKNMEHRKNTFKVQKEGKSDTYMQGFCDGMIEAYQEMCQLLEVDSWPTKSN